MTKLLGFKNIWCHGGSRRIFQERNDRGTRDVKRENSVNFLNFSPSGSWWTSWTGDSRSKTGKWGVFYLEIGVFFIWKSRTHHVNEFRGKQGRHAVLGRLTATIVGTDESGGRGTGTLYPWGRASKKARRPTESVRSFFWPNFHFEPRNMCDNAIFALEHLMS